MASTFLFVSVYRVSTFRLLKSGHYSCCYVLKIVSPTKEEEKNAKQSCLLC